MAQAELVDLIVQAIQHRGTALLDILQPCPIYNDLMTVDFFRGSDIGSQRVYKLSEEGFDGRVADAGNADEIVAKQQAAIAKSFEWGDRIPTGVLYQVDMPTYEDGLASRRAELASTNLVELMDPGQDVSGLEDGYR